MPREPAERLLRPRHARLFLLCAIVLVPWTIWLFVSLPDRNVSHRWSLTWGGFDTLLIAVFIACAVRIIRFSPLTAVACAAASALLVTDAWFDITTAGSKRDLWTAAAMAVVIEIPLSIACLRISLRVARLFEQARPYLTAAGFRIEHGRLVPPPDWPPAVE